MITIEEILNPPNYTEMSPELLIVAATSEPFVRLTSVQKSLMCFVRSVQKETDPETRRRRADGLALILEFVHMTLSDLTSQALVQIHPMTGGVPNKPPSPSSN